METGTRSASSLTSSHDNHGHGRGFGSLTTMKILFFFSVGFQAVAIFRKSSELKMVQNPEIPSRAAAWINGIDAPPDTTPSASTVPEILAETGATSRLEGIDAVHNEKGSVEEKGKNRTKRGKGENRTKRGKGGKIIKRGKGGGGFHPNFTAPIKAPTHFFSHVPKSGTEYAATELLRLLKATIPLPHNLTETSVTVAQNRFNNANNTLNDFFAPYKQMDHVNFPVDLNGTTDAYTPPFICNSGTTPFRMISPYFVNMRTKTRYSCAMAVTESPWNHHAPNVYTILREPFSHTLSQYFHCAESIDHGRKRIINGTELENRTKLMPSLETWLETYAALNDEHLENSARINRTTELRHRFRCYNPIDSESEYTKFDLSSSMTDNYTYPYYSNNNDDHDRDRSKSTTQRDETEKKLDTFLFNDLKQRYKIIGDMSQMVKTLCAIFIDFTQGKHIPEVCDCSNTTTEVGGTVTETKKTTSSSTFCVRNLYTHPLPELVDKKACPIRIGYDATNNQYSHGVKHHGSSFLSQISDHQRELIGKLRRKDLVLYNISRAVFAEQIQDMEDRYGITVCDQWNRRAAIDQ